MKQYQPANWYWGVGGDTTKVYSTAIANYVPSNDPVFLAWRAENDGKVPQTATEVSLGELLAPHFLRPIPSAILDAYKEAQAATLTPIDVVPQLLFMMENQIRALQGNPPLTFAQFRAFVKSLM